MDYFENIIFKILENENKWVRQNVKVNLTVEEKRKTGKPSIPRPDLDLVAYNIKTNTLEIWEVKSYLDSPGVKYSELNVVNEKTKGRYKILTTPSYRKIVANRLINDWFEEGLIQENPSVKFGLAAGKIYSKDEEDIRNLFNKNDWLLKSPKDIYNSIRTLEKMKYENNPYTIAAKIIFRNQD